MSRSGRAGGGLPKKLRVVFYAVNGSGVGHLTRLIAIARWVRRYAKALHVQPEIYFLSSSEATPLLFHERFAAFKLPSKSVIRDAEIDKLTYLALAKQWVWSSLALLRPDILVVDTFPRGSFGELLNALDLCRHKAFVYRPLKRSFAEREDFQAMLPVYDRVLVPDTEDAAGEVLCPERARSRLVFTGPVTAREPAELLPRAVARERLAIPADRLAVYVSAGGGGDAGGGEQLCRVVEALGGDERLHLVIGCGPLYRGARPLGLAPRATWLVNERASEHMLGFDLAVAACGYNTFHELMLAGVPTVFLPQPKIADEQDRRADRAVAAGAAARLDALPSADALRAAVERFVPHTAREVASEAAHRVCPRSHARTAAQEVLRLVFSERVLEIAEELIDDRVLALGSADREQQAALFTLLSILDPRPRDALSPGGASDLGEAGVELLAAITDLGLELAEALRVARPFLRKLPPARASERAEALASVLAAFAPFADWAGADLVLRAFRAERTATPSELAEALAGFLEQLRAQGADLYEGLRRLGAAQDPKAVDAPTNLALLAAATATAGAGAAAQPDGEGDA